MKQVIQGLEEGLGAIATALEGDGYPKPTNVPQGKVLTADGDDGASWEDAPSGLPTIPGSGEVLMTEYDAQNDEYYARWTSQWGQMPPYQYANVGDVVTIDAYGNPTWAAPSGGGSVPTITSNDNGKVLSAVYDDKSGSGYAEWVTPSGGGGVVSTTFTVDGSDFVQDGSSYKVVFDSNGDYQGDMGLVISARIYYSGMCSIPCSLIYIDKTGWIARVTADDYTYISMTSGLTLKIFSQN